MTTPREQRIEYLKSRQGNLSRQIADLSREREEVRKRLRKLQLDSVEWVFDDNDRVQQTPTPLTGHQERYKVVARRADWTGNIFDYLVIDQEGAERRVSKRYLERNFRKI